jgi:hypothetical protein
MKRYFTLLTAFIFLFISITSYAQRPDDIIFKTYAGGGGKCFGRSMISNHFDTIEEKVIIRPAYSYLKEIPPVYKNETERILVEPAHTRIEVTPAEFETITEKIKVKNADSYTNPTTTISENDLFSNTSSQHELSPSYKQWEKTKIKENCQSTIPENCLEWQLVDVPATIIFINKKERANKELPTSKAPTISSSEQFMTITRKVLKKEASYKEVQVPAQYATVTKQILVTPRRFEQVQIPATTQSINKIILIREGGFMEANEVVCKEDYPRYMRNLQLRLKDRGLFNGNIDGRLNKATKNAIVAFQVKNNLPVGQLDYKTLKMLDLVK